MEKRYLVVMNGSSMIGAFEDVKAVVKDDKGVAIRSSEGEFIFTKDDQGVYSAPNCTVQFTDYRYVGRRTVERMAQQMGFHVPDRRVNKYYAHITK